MSISVAMVTRDGSRYVDEQLRSILDQLEPPDEIVVGDDRSVDDTVGRILRQGVDSPVPIHVDVADEARGVVANVESVLSRATGDRIALADQ
ncbi:MAG: glycosyltransferase, partial [Actinomycetota bacterium]